MRFLVTSVLAGAFALVLAVPAAAQAPGLDVKLNPRIGLYVPLTDLGEVGSDTWALDNSLAVGLGVELQLAALPFGIRGNLDYATSSTVNLESGGVEQGETDATLLAISADLVFRPLPRVVVLQPYLFAGGGLKQYDFDLGEAGDFESEVDESDPTVHLGVGLDFGLGPLALNAEVADYISWFEITDGDSEMQHDLFVMVGFSIGML